jgi:hypothetical protein
LHGYKKGKTANLFSSFFVVVAVGSGIPEMKKNPYLELTSRIRNTAGITKTTFIPAVTAAIRFKYFQLSFFFILAGEEEKQRSGQDPRSRVGSR